MPGVPKPMAKQGILEGWFNNLGKAHSNYMVFLYVNNCSVEKAKPVSHLSFNLLFDLSQLRVSLNLHPFVPTPPPAMSHSSAKVEDVIKARYRCTSNGPIRLHSGEKS